ncbi:uncharacterized protein A4U43_C05F18900 [Asparagus officinalis]|uniref:Protein kinase domain-containing protein n=1 Tax=Asparagus officinalis TaxID=4686 RepID=A0A5P1ETR6_ASPOF|nr:protein MALE DISCOVERER 2-like [Asparagus officinalis]ONK69063.1 uncharacterized protein A4U43_C05F18900 [Asparagus officinalis]
MRERWIRFGFCAAALFFLHCQIYGCFSLNLEGLALLEFRSGVEIDPHGVFENWNPNDDEPCNWSGVRCIDGKVETLYLNELSLGGVLAPEIGLLSHLKALILHRNNFTGVIPKEIGRLTMLELLDLRGNNLNGTIPRELGDMLSLKCLLLCGNKFGGGISWIEKLDVVSDLKCNSDFSCKMANEIGCANRKVGHWSNIISDFPNYHGEHGDNLLSNSLNHILNRCVHVTNTVRRQLLQETSNLPAVPVGNPPVQEFAEVPSVGSGSFPAVPSSKDGNGGREPSRWTMPANPPDSSPSGQSLEDNNYSSKRLGIWVYILIAVGAVFLVLAAIILLACCRRKGGPVGPWKTGLSGQLQKAFVTGVPKLNRAELEAACEDFSNIITSFPTCTLFKGTLSSGVEIGVVSTTVKSAMDWSERSELCFRKKIDTLSRVNHKNFVNLLGYCEENEPFMRMMVLEYSPNGTLFDHLHVKEYEHLEWSARMRVIMGMGYCLQYMHHELNPPVTLSDLRSDAVFITDDFAAKIVDISLFNESKKIASGVDSQDTSKLLDTDTESNVYSFGMLMLEVISGKFPYSEEEGSIVDWGAPYLEDEINFRSMVDPALKAANDNELETVCGIIRKCLCHDPRKRPTMREVMASLKEVLGISAEAATPRLSPLWWAELEILSVEAS